MAVCYCKECGNVMVVSPGEANVKCEHCGAWQTPPESAWRIGAPVLPVPSADAAPQAEPEPKTVLIPDAAKEAEPAAAPAGEKETVAAPAEEAEAVPDPVQKADPAQDVFAPPEKTVRKVMLNAETAALLRRALLFLEDGDWKSADEYCERVLDLEPECAEAYVGKLMAELQVSRPEQLGDYEWPLDGLNNYRKAVRFANEKLRVQLEGYLEQTHAKIPEHYAKAKQIMSDVYFYRYRDALHILEKIPDYRDAQKMIEFCKKKIEGEDEEDDAGGCFAVGCLLALVFLFLFMVVGIASVITSIA